jgi:hypothetical protein
VLPEYIVLAEIEFAEKEKTLVSPVPKIVKSV